MLAGRAMKAALEQLSPLLTAAGAMPAGVVVAGNVKGDLYDIGKNLVISMLEGAGHRHAAERGDGGARGRRDRSPYRGERHCRCRDRDAYARRKEPLKGTKIDG